MKKKSPERMGFARWLFCEVLKWHNGKGDVPKYAEGDDLHVNLKSRCSRCGRSVTKDSQGNWF